MITDLNRESNIIRHPGTKIDIFIMVHPFISHSPFGLSSTVYLIRLQVRPIK